MLNSFKGWAGEKITSFLLWRHLPSGEYFRINDIIIPAQDGTTQIDHVVVSQFGIFVIETKNYQGWIFGSPKDARWTQSLGGRKYLFQNPLRQNYRHTKCLSEFLDRDHEIFHSVVFFIGKSTFKTPMPPNVLDQGLTTYIKTFSAPCLDLHEVGAIRDTLLILKKDSALSKAAHLESLTQRHAPSKKSHHFRPNPNSSRQ